MGPAASGVVGNVDLTRLIREGATASVATCSNPNPNDPLNGAPGNTGGTDDPTPLDFAGDPQDGTFTITNRIWLRNVGNVVLNQVQVTDDLRAVFGALPFVVQSVSAEGATANPGFNGETDINLLSGTDSLLPELTAWVDLVVVLTTTSNFGPFMNQALAVGTPPIGEPLSVMSDSGSNPDPSDVNAGAPGDSGGNQDPTALSLPVPNVDLSLDKTGTVSGNRISWNHALFVGTLAFTGAESKDLFAASLLALGLGGVLVMGAGWSLRPDPRPALAG